MKWKDIVVGFRRAARSSHACLPRPLCVCTTSFKMELLTKPAGKDGVQLFAKSHGSCFFHFIIPRKTPDWPYMAKKNLLHVQDSVEEEEKKRIPMLNFSFNVCPRVLGYDVILFTKRKWKKKKRQRLGSSSASPQTLTDGEKNDNNIESLPGQVNHLKSIGVVQRSCRPQHYATDLISILIRPRSVYNSTITNKRETMPLKWNRSITLRLWPLPGDFWSFPRHRKTISPLLPSPKALRVVWLLSMKIVSRSMVCAFIEDANRACRSITKTPKYCVHQ